MVSQLTRVLCFVFDSHFARCISIWRCQRIPTHLGPSPAKNLSQELLWPQVQLFENNTKNRCAYESSETSQILSPLTTPSDEYIAAVQQQKRSK